MKYNLTFFSNTLFFSIFILIIGVSACTKKQEPEPGKLEVMSAFVGNIALQSAAEIPNIPVNQDFTIRKDEEVRQLAYFDTGDWRTVCACAGIDEDAGNAVAAIVIFAGNEDGSRLMAYIDEGQPSQLPLTLLNGKFFFRWNPAGIFRI